MINKIFDGKVVQFKMIYLTKVLIILFVYFTSPLYANDNKIIFQVNGKIFSKIDFENRIRYINLLNSSNLETKLETELVNDFFESVIFFEYIIKNKYLNNQLELESENLLKQINAKNNQNYIDEKVIIKNIKYDFARKIVLEDILNNYKEYIFSNPRDMNFIYNYKINYITIPINNLKNQKEFEEILKLENFKNLIIYLDKTEIKYHLELFTIKDLNKINRKIKGLINNKKKFLFEKNTDFYRISNIEKKLDINNGVYYKLINLETEILLEKNQQNCNYISSLDNIKLSKEYEFNKLNNSIKENLVSINDFIIFKKEKLNNYIFLCEIKINEEFLEEITINKRINFLAKDIASDFINKYSKIYNSKKYYE